MLPGEGPVATRLLALMVCAWAGFAIGGNAIEGLLLARVGVEVLPYLYVGLGLLSAGIMLAFNVLLARPFVARALLRALVGATGVVVATRALLEIREDWVYALAWLTMMVLWTGVNVVTWGIAAVVHDTRQGKRLFPLYAAGVILGTALGGLATPPLAHWLGAENLPLVWAAALVAGSGFARSVLRDAQAPRRARWRRVTARARVAEGLRAVRRSRLLTSMALLIALFALLYFSIALLFARAAAARFGDADGLAGFLGLFMGLTSATALLFALSVARPLSARLGVASLVVALPVVYLAGFGALVVWMAFVPLVGFRFVQQTWTHGVWAGAWQALYNVIPGEVREASRAIVDGVAFQAGVVVAGVVLIVADRVAGAAVVALCGVVAAGLAVVIARRLRRAYEEALMAALRAGNPDVFVVEREPFAGVGRDAAAMSILSRASADDDVSMRRIAMELVARIAEPRHRAVLERGLADRDPVVRAAAVRGRASVSLEEGDDRAWVLTLLDDPDPGVRLAAVEAVFASPRALGVAVRKLLADDDARVRARSAAGLLGAHDDAEAREALSEMARSQRAEERVEAIRGWAASDDGVVEVASAVADHDPMVRRAAVRALAGRPARAAVGALVGALADRDRAIRAEAVDALVLTGTASIPVLMDAAIRPELQAGAMTALARLRALDTSVAGPYLRRKVTDAVRYAGLARALAKDENARVALLASSLRHASRRHAVEALMAVGASGGAETAAAIELAVANLEARDPAQRANAVEMLDAIGEPDVVRPLVTVWEERSPPPMGRQTVLAEALLESDPWLRASAAFAAPVEPALRARVEELARADADTLVRDAAAAALIREPALETLSSLSLMERIVFLHGVSLFHDLSPDDLKHIAEIATEHSFSDGTVIAEEGEPGDDLHVVVTGKIDVLAGRDGGTVEVARRGPGECVGEMAVISRAPRMASLRARGDVRTLAIDRRRFETILRDRPETSLAVMQVLCDRLRELHGAEPLEATS